MSAESSDGYPIGYIRMPRQANPSRRVDLVRPGASVPHRGPPLLFARVARRRPRLLECIGAALFAGILAGCQPAQSNDGGNDKMVFGMFKKKFATTVSPDVGATLQRETAFPRAFAAAPAPAWPPLRNVSVDGPPPGGQLAKARAEHPPAEAFVVDVPGQPSLAVVNTYEDDRRSQIWELDAHDPTRFARQRPVQFDAEQSKWIMYTSESVLALPAGQLLIQLRYHKPRTVDGLYVYDAAANRMRSLGEVEPDWAQGVPFRYVDSLQLKPDTLLVVYHTDKERLGPQRFVNHFDHLVLFSPRHRDGLEIVTLGLDDGNVRHWGLEGSRLWLQAADDRGAAPRQFVWSLDLARVL
jgi:hypothetical protein